ncbi:unnamed protein product, partial [Scytosiphon promiscuus]
MVNSGTIQCSRQQTYPLLLYQLLNCLVTSSRNIELLAPGGSGGDKHDLGRIRSITVGNGPHRTRGTRMCTGRWDSNETTQRVAATVTGGASYFIIFLEYVQ